MIANGEILIRKEFPPFQLQNPPDWTANPHKNKTWQLYYYSLAWLSGFMVDPQPEDWSLIKSIVLSCCDFIIEHLDDLEHTLRDDHATAYRASYLAHVYAAGLAPLLTDSERGRVRFVVEKHVELLTAFLRSEKWQHSNHTLFHAEGLADIALVFMTNPERRAQTIRFAAGKVSEFIAAAATLDAGTFKEHAIFYHVFLMGRIFQTTDFFESLGHSVENIGTEEYSRMLEFLYHAMPVPGRLPGIGDSKHNQTFDKKYTAEFEDPKYLTDVTRFLKSCGESGKAPAFLTEYPDDGYFIFRSEFGQPQLFSMVLHKPFKGPHGHWDGASFVTYFDGQPILIDSGGPYKYGDPMRYHYFQTQLAHNVLIFDEHPRSYTTTLIGTAQTHNAGMVGLVSRMDDEICWFRFICQFGNKAHVILDLPVSPSDSCQAVARLHVDPELEIIKGQQDTALKSDAFEVVLQHKHVDLQADTVGAIISNCSHLQNGAPHPYEGPNDRQLRALPDGYKTQSFVTYKDNTLQDSQLLASQIPMNQITVSIVRYQEGFDLSSISALDDQLVISTNNEAFPSVRIALNSRENELPSLSLSE